MTSTARDLPPVAQTNVQLYNQLRAGGWSDGDVARAKVAYELSVRILGSRFRPDGKPFTSHGIGTASILAGIGCDADVVIAGMLHAAYDWGDWGEGSHMMTDTKRAAVRDVVGAPAEALVAAYTRTRWRQPEIEAILARVGDLDAQEHDVVLIQIANSLDDNVELGMRYRGKTAAMVADDRVVSLNVEVARRLGMTALADRLHAARDAELVTEVPSDLAYDGGYDQIPPLTHRRRLLVWLRAGDSSLSRATRGAAQRLPRRVRRFASPR